MALSTRNLTKRAVPRAPFARIAGAILPGYDLSLALVTEKVAQDANANLRKKSYIPNVLAFETGKKAGEVLICLAEAKRQAPEYEMTYPQFVSYLFIHACLHLKGYPHGATMDRLERAHLARFSIVPKISNGPTNSNRNRYRNAPNENRRRRGD